MRYFVRFYYQNLIPEAVLLFRLDIDNLAETLTEEQWDDANGVWIPTDRIMPVLILGNTDIDEVDADNAQKFFPQAFQERTIDTSVLERISVEVVSGISKEQSKFAPLTAELEATWDKIAKEAKEIEAMGYTVDIVSEIPDVEIPKTPGQANK